LRRVDLLDVHRHQPARPILDRELDAITDRKAVEVPRLAHRRRAEEDVVAVLRAMNPFCWRSIRTLPIMSLD
jgi:hypothetical protein